MLECLQTCVVNIDFKDVVGSKKLLKPSKCFLIDVLNQFLHSFEAQMSGLSRHVHIFIEIWNCLLSLLNELRIVEMIKDSAFEDFQMVSKFR